VDEDLDYLNSKYIGSEYGNLRRERAQLQRQMLLHNDAIVKPRIREITLQLQAMLSSKNRTADVK
jgi:hypothetical protein